MRRISAILLLCCYTFTLAGCARVYVKEQDPMELWGANAQVFEGRVYSATSKDRDSAIKKIAQIAKKKGYNYFTLMYDKSSVSHIASGSFGNTNGSVSAYGGNNYANAYGNINTNTFGYSSPVYMFSVMAFFLKDDELDGWKNVYSVKKYIK